MNVVICILQYADRTWPVLIIGALMFIPGAYHVRIAYYAYKGYDGYSYDDIPEFDWTILNWFCVSYILCAYKHKNNFILQKFIAVKMSVCSIFNFRFMYALKVILKQADSVWNQYFICQNFMMICWFSYIQWKKIHVFSFFYISKFGLFLLL